MSNESGEDAVARGASALRVLITEAGLEDVYERFLLITEGPEDGNCIVPVAVNLHTTFSNQPFWAEDRIEPFEGWDELVRLIVENQAELVAISAHLSPPPRNIKWRGEMTPANPMHGDIHRHPIFAMLCTSQELEEYRPLLGALHLQVLHARWIEARKGAEERGLEPIEAFRLSRAKVDRWVRLSDSIARSVRELSLRHFGPLLESLNPCQTPDEFRARLKSKSGITEERDYLDYFSRIRNHCLWIYGARDGESHVGGKHASSGKHFREFVNYNCWCVGFELSPNHEKGGARKKTIYERQRGANRAARLGLHPLEMTGGRAVVHEIVPGAKSPREATAVAQANARSWEVDHRLFQWSSRQLRLEDFRRGILPILERIARDASCESDSNLELAAFLAIQIDTCRDTEDILNLRIVRDSNDGFTYKRTAQDEASRTWSWDTIGPDYKSTANYPPKMEAPRAWRLHYPASRVVTDLVEQHMKRASIRLGKLFRSDTNYGAATERWIQEHDPTGNCTLAKLVGLRWKILHRITGGEIASACLTLGIHDSQASVELHYAILKVTDASRLFHESSCVLWGKRNIDSRDITPETGKIVGIRGYPRLSLIKEVISWMRAGSQEFFCMKVADFNPSNSEHAGLLNRAVLYVVWHQFFTFSTRAIRDAYQGACGFSEITGLGILSDKDFEDHHKTRLIWANQRLLKHMKAIEGRLGILRERMTDFRFRKNSSVWLIGNGRRILRVTPGSIDSLLLERFPFEVNTPRKVMRNLMREAGLTHEQAEVMMGHWWQAREPWAPFSSFDWRVYLNTMQVLVPRIHDDLGFDWVPGERA